MKYIIDSHSHVQFPAYDSDRDAVIKRAQEAGVKMITVGTQFSTSEAGIKLAQKYPEDIWATVGFHPSHAAHARTNADDNNRGLTQTIEWHHDLNEQKDAQPEEFDIGRLRELAKDPKVAAIGECGLDYFRIMNNESGIKELQKKVFLEQANVAQELQKPLMIHCRPSKGTDDAYEDLLGIIPNSKFLIPKIVHFYVGSPAITKKLVNEGFYFTFGGVTTFARDYDESIKLIPIERILLETDCPYVAPKSQRGKRNEPSFILETAEMIARIKEIKSDEFLDITYKNSKEVFGI